MLKLFERHSYRERRRYRELWHPLFNFLDGYNELGLRWAEARNVELLAPRHLNHPPLLIQVTGRGAELEVEQLILELAQYGY